MTQDTPLMTALRAILTLLGSYLVGHVLIGHTITADLWQLLVGAALTITGAVTEIISTNTTPTQLQSAIGTVATAIGGVLLALGVVNQQTWTSIIGVVTALVPLFQKQTTKLTVKHLLNGKAVGDKLTGAVKKAAIILLLIGFSTVAKSQSFFKSLPKPELKLRIDSNGTSVQTMNAIRPIASIAAYVEPNNILMAGAGFGYQHLTWTVSSQTWYCNWSVNIIGFAGGA